MNNRYLQLSLFWEFVFFSFFFWGGGGQPQKGARGEHFPPRVVGGREGPTKLKKTAAKEATNFATQKSESFEIY